MIPSTNAYESAVGINQREAKNVVNAI